MTTQEKGKAKKTMMKKRKLVDVEAKRAVAVAAATERVERGGLGVVSVLQINFHQLRGLPSRGLRVFMVVQLGLSCLEDDVLL